MTNEEEDQQEEKKTSSSPQKSPYPSPKKKYLKIEDMDDNMGEE